MIIAQGSFLAAPVVATAPVAAAAEEPAVSVEKREAEVKSKNISQFNC